MPPKYQEQMGPAKGLGQIGPEKPSPSLGKLAETIDEAIKVRTASKVLSELDNPTGPPQPTQNKDEAMSPGWGKLILETSTNLHKEVVEEKKLAEAGRTQAETQLHQERAKSLQEAEARLISLGERIQAGGPTRNVVAEFGEIAAGLKAIRETFGWGTQETKPAAPQVSGELMVRLAEIQGDQAMRLEEYRTDRQEHQNEFLLEMKKWEDESRFKWRELEDKKERGAKLGEHLSNAIANISQKWEGGGGQQPVAPQSPPPMGIALDTGDCPTCHKPFYVPKGASLVGCPHCGTAMKTGEKSEQPVAPSGPP